MQGILRHSASIWKGMYGKPYPTAGLQTIVYDSYYEIEGTYYANTNRGFGIPVVGALNGLETILDFSVLNDVRFDKGSYLGNSYGLPPYYDFPYVNIYYDPTNATTRKYWKLKDFHYANILAQSLTLDNQFFLKATATTDTSNIISTIDRLFIYSSSLSGLNLTKIKNYIGIQADFLGGELLGSLYNSQTFPFNVFTFLNMNLHASQIGGAYAAAVTSGIETKKGDVFHYTHENFTLNSGVGEPKLLFQNNIGGVGASKSNVIFTPSLSTMYIFTITETGTWYFEIGDRNVTMDFSFTNISLKQFYQNYYKQ